MSSVIFPSAEAFLRAQGVPARADGSFMEDSYDYGVWWRDRAGAAHRLTWIGPTHRDLDHSGELYLVRLSDGRVEFLCVIPPLPGQRPADANVEAILDGWAEVCGQERSVDWIRDRVWEALRAGWARQASSGLLPAARRG